MIIHTLEKEKHEDFLKQERVDPITGDLLEENDKIVICAGCKSAFLADSWEYIGRKHCNQSITLKQIPKSQVVKLEKNLLENLIEIKTISNLSASYLLAILPSLIVCLPIILYSLLNFSFDWYLINYYHIIVSVFTLSFFLSSPYKNNFKIGKYALSFGKKKDKNNSIPYEDIASIELYEPKRFRLLNKSRKLSKSKNYIYALKITNKNQLVKKVLIEKKELENSKTNTIFLEKLNKNFINSTSVHIEIEQHST